MGFFANRLRRGGGQAGLAAVLILGGVGSAGAVTSANQVCSAAANPCTVTSVVQVDDGAVLDFGTRAVQLSGNGQLNFGAGSGSILCGPFSAATAGTAINARGSVTGGSVESGSVLIEARRRCSAGATPPPCVSDEECQLGTCGVRRCSGRPTRLCTSDASCTVGPCGTNKRCAGASGIVRCNTNADCDYGTCPEQLTCANRSTLPVQCSVNADCDFGACSVGAASISMGGAVVGNSTLPAVLTLRAADSVSILKTVNLSSTFTEADGGELAIEAAAGSVTVSSKITVSGGSAAQGGSVDMAAGTDIVLAEEVSVAGGDFDGGSVVLRAGRDVTLSRSILANSAFGAGYGGEILASAGRDLLVSGASTSNPAALEANGHTDTSGSAGDGGTVDLSSTRDATLSASSRLTGRGASTAGNGGQTFVEAGRNLSLSGKIEATTSGTAGGGGLVDLVSGGSSSVASTATFLLNGGSRGGGTFTLSSAGPLAFAGSANVGATGSGPGGSASLVSAAESNMTGTLAVTGSGRGFLSMLACRLTLASGGLLDNKAVGGENRLTARENMKLLAGSTMSATSGTNVHVYRTAAKPPLVQGVVTPTAQKIVNGSLVGCPICGNAEVDDGETCDDGNTVGGDGCSADCQNENCIAQTVAPGYPAVPLCEDGKPCTDDFCNTAQNGGTCRHRAKNCDDGFACTSDACVDGLCVNAPNHALCGDDDPCTDDFCSPGIGCSTVANNDPCNDGDSCTRDDRCLDLVCAGIPVEVCGDCGDGIVEDPEECDDGNATFTNGEDCGVGCVRIPCGKPTNSTGSAPKAGDALFALRAAVQLVTCSLRVCDADGNGAVTAADALRILRAAVGLQVALRCPL
jgi:cysteine-rich repeat protein